MSDRLPIFDGGLVRLQKEVRRQGEMLRKLMEMYKEINDAIRDAMRQGQEREGEGGDGTD